MTNRDRASLIAGAAAVWLIAAALSAAAPGTVLGEDTKAPAGGPAAAAPAPAAPAAPAAQPAPQQPAAAPPAVAAPAAAPPTAAAPAALAPTAAAPASPPPPAADSKPGFLQEFGRWWKESIAKFGTNMKDAQKKLDDFNKGQQNAAKEAMKNAAEATKDAATAIVRLPGTRAIEVHQACPKAPNGAPDCQEAAVSACRGKGFNTGKPLDVSSSEKCVTTMWLSGQSQGECRVETETILARALCQ
jgi:potassium-dependent mechanosensitive channel